MTDAEAMSGSFGPGDPSQDTKLAARRQMEAARLRRLKDPKMRVMGIDTDALAAQIEEKRQAALLEKQLAAEYDAQRLAQDAQIAYLEQERLRTERQKAKFVDTFRQTEQGKLKMREYDLNDPLALKSQLPGRMGDDDARCSVSGLQKFHGEDLSYAARVKVQQQELRSWMDDAVAMKAAVKAKEKAADDAFAVQAIEVDGMKVHLEATSRAASNSNSVALAEYQLAQAAAKREREAAAQKAELQDNVEEIQATLSSDMLVENPAVGRSFIAPNRLRPDHYKGMAPTQQLEFRAAQEVQRQQAAAKAAAAKAQDAAEDAMLESMRSAGAYQDAQVAAMRADMRKKMMAENGVLAEQQFASKAYMKTVYTNAMDASFYDQFGTTAR